MIFYSVRHYLPVDIKFKFLLTMFETVNDIDYQYMYPVFDWHEQLDVWLLLMIYSITVCNITELLKDSSFLYFSGPLLFLHLCSKTRGIWNGESSWLIDKASNVWSFKDFSMNKSSSSILIKKFELLLINDTNLSI